MPSVTIDSNLWEQIVDPQTFPQPPEKNQRLVTVHQALEAGRIEAYISVSVITLEAVPRKDRPAFLTGQTMRPRTVETDDPEIKPVIFAPDQGGRPKVKPILRDRLQRAAALGIRIIKTPDYHEMQLPGDNFVEMDDEAIQCYGQASFEIERRGVGRAVLKRLGHRIGCREGGTYVYSVGALPPVQSMTPDEQREAIKAVAEAADADAVAAHIAMNNDYFVTEDCGKTAGVSVLDKTNRQWLTATFGLEFLTLQKLAAMM